MSQLKGRFLLLSLIVLSSLIACKPSPINYPDATVEKAPKIGFSFVVGTNIPLSSYGFQAEEFFFRGEARSYVNSGDLGSDGKWQVEPAESAIYKSRMLVYRPQDPAKFNGTVIVEWLNVTAGMDTATEWIYMHNEILRRGYAWVGVSAQQVGVGGGASALPTPIGFSLSLKLLNPLRYLTLDHPGDSFSYDIYSQAARAVRYPTGIAPLGDLPVNKVIAAGESQSATRLMTYVNAFGKDDDVFDGYFIHSRLGFIPEFGGASAQLSQPPQAYVPTAPVVKVRDDLGKPVMNLQTETDVLRIGSYASRQEDTDTYRLWEVAGTAHADRYIISSGMMDQGSVDSAKVVITNRPLFVLPACPDPVNSAPQHHFVLNTALNALNRWLVDEIAPPMAPRLLVNANGDAFEYDAYGNVLGGVRSPYVDSPIARFSGENTSIQDDSADLCFLFGSTEMLDDATLQSLYPGHDAYVAAVTESTLAAQANGFLLPEDGRLIIRAAEESDIPPQ